MEGLMELVAACFARHGIECPTGDRQLARPATQPRRTAPLSRPPPPRSRSTITARVCKAIQLHKEFGLDFVSGVRLSDAESSSKSKAPLAAGRRAASNSAASRRHL